MLSSCLTINVIECRIFSLKKILIPKLQFTCMHCVSGMRNDIKGKHRAVKAGFSDDDLEQPAFNMK